MDQSETRAGTFSIKGSILFLPKCTFDFLMRLCFLVVNCLSEEILSIYRFSDWGIRLVAANFCSHGQEAENEIESGLEGCGNRLILSVSLMVKCLYQVIGGTGRIVLLTREPSGDA